MDESSEEGRPRSQSGNRSLSAYVKDRLVMRELIVRFIDWLSAVVVFGTIADRGRLDGCWFGYENGKSRASACDFGIFMGVMTWLLEFAMTFILLMPALFPSRRLPNSMHACLYYFGVLWTFLWFANAMNLAVQYTVTCTTMVDLGQKCKDRDGQEAQLGAVFFSWVCVVLWILMTYWARTRYLEALQQQIPSTVDHHDGGGTVAVPAGAGPEYSHSHSGPVATPESSAPMQEGPTDAVEHGV